MKEGWYVIQIDSWGRSVLPKRYLNKEDSEKEASFLNSQNLDECIVFEAEYTLEEDLPNE